MALKYPDILKSNNPAAYGIVDGREVSGHKTVVQLAATAADDIADNRYGLYGIPDKILSPSGNNTDNDAIGQVWYCVANSKFYRLSNWANRTTSLGWTEVVFPTKSEFDDLTNIDLTPYVKFTDLATSSKAGAMSAAQVTKLAGIATKATADSALTTAEIDEVCV